MRVLITRPEPGAIELATLCKNSCIDYYLWPSMVIIKPRRPQALHAALQQCQTNDVVIFVSPTAVRQALEQMRLDEKHSLSACQLFAVGPGTAQMLMQQGLTDVIFPKDSANSEALLVEPKLQNIAKRNVWIMRGQTGRALLAHTLRQRGAKVHYVACYQQQQNTQYIDTMIQAWQERLFDIVISTSLNGLQYLWQAMPINQRYLLQATRVTVTSEKMLTWARAHGIKQTIMLTDVRNHAILTRLISIKENQI